jgi:hypothetical protein
MLGASLVFHRLHVENKKGEPWPRKKRELGDGYQHKTKEIFIASEASHGYSNGHPFDTRTLTRVCHFENHTSCAGYLDGQANYPTFQRKVHKRCDGRVANDMCCRLVNLYRTHHQHSVTSGETYQKIEGSMKPISGTRCMKSGFNRGV